MRLKSLLILVLALSLSSSINAQNYQANWESLDTRPIPTWFGQAKFGIFIHWGVYAVPGWSTKGNYAEWYQNGLNGNDTARIAYQKKRFGDRSYYDLAKDFKAELYNPDEWAKLIEKSGAKYVVLTSKHHDGYAIWPSKETDKTWGFPWNSVTTGPHRDLLGDLFTALRKTSVRPGMYYSLYEWYNPLYKKDKKSYVDNHMYPQMLDLINTYKPDIFWTDGDWDLPAETWRSQEFLAWLYNSSPVKNSVVTYDRWGSGIRFNHGQVYTPEYQPDLDFEDHAWEESRGMGYSYGYNRAEDAWDYNTTQSLIISLVDKVSRGGNFLLDIGPDEHGKIPPILQERLLQMGDWLTVNGEAIYNTVRWKNAFQWSEGNQHYQSKKVEGDWKTTNDYMTKITIDPDPGFAVKEVFYTYNPTTNALYAILPKYPSNKKIRLKNVILPKTASLSLLGSTAKVAWQIQNDATEIDLPEYDPNVFKVPYAYVLKIAGFGQFAHKPEIEVVQNNKTLQTTVQLKTNATAVYYTVDGSEPTTKSTNYSKPFHVTTRSTIKAIALQDGALESNMSVKEANVYDWKVATKIAVKQGINYEYLEPDGKINMETVTNTAVKTKGITNTLSIDKKERKDKFAFRFTGYVYVEKDDLYTFYLDSDDGSKLWVDGEEVAENDAAKGKPQPSGTIALKKGYHKIGLWYYDSGGGNNLTVSIEPLNGKKSIISVSQLFH
jgi:alpha-L-fucosidase